MASDALSNPRWEAFAHGLYKGETADEAYRNAGYTPNRGNATRLKANEAIRNRLAQLQEQGARMANVTVQTITEELNEAITMARRQDNAPAFTQAVMAKAKIHGLDINRSENLNTNFVISDEPEVADEDWIDRYKPN